MKKYYNKLHKDNGSNVLHRQAIMSSCSVLGNVVNEKATVYGSCSSRSCGINGARQATKCINDCATSIYNIMIIRLQVGQLIDSEGSMRKI